MNLLLFFVLPTLVQAAGLMLGFVAVGLPGWLPAVAVFVLYVLPLAPVGPTLHRAVWSLSLLGFAAAIVA